ncbi:MAG: TraR/DksA C4-type zinc finger protein [Patescibacteria group bacterium]
MTLSPAVIKNCKQKLQQLLKDTDKDREAIMTALQKMEDKKYGTCVNCKKEINPERLKFLPTALRCVECQTDIERRVQEITARRVACNSTRVLLN